ncbi:MULTISPECIES: hypothetical protein [unclassified Paenibacillus]|uniref:hypothetical protein n=1 Tax=unclassified Paenibacillus TaxID=185978 RepID=UPI0038392BA8
MSGNKRPPGNWRDELEYIVQRPERGHECKCKGQQYERGEFRIESKKRRIIWIPSPGDRRLFV